MHPNTSAAAPVAPPAQAHWPHWHTRALSMGGAAVETVHATYPDALATGRRLAVEAAGDPGTVRWHADGFTTNYYTCDAAGRLAAWVVVGDPCTGRHDGTADTAL